MKFLKSYFFYITVTLAFLIFLIFILSMRMLYLYDVTVSEDKGKTESIKLPYNKNSNFAKSYIFKAEINYNFFKSKIINIIPDDCVLYIKINNQNILLNDKIISGKNCDYIKGFHINIGKYLNKGHNTIEIMIKNYGYNYGLKIKQSKHDIINIILLILIILFFLILIYFILSKLKFDRYQIFVFLAAVLIFIIYLNYTNYNDRGHDTQGHLDYINWIIKNKKLPAINNCWQCYHPPIYYILSSIIFSSTNIFKNGDPYFFLQIFSLIIFIIFLMFSIKIMNLFINKKEMRIVFSALFLFWPSMVLHSIRIGNDILYYLFFVLSLYYLIIWHRYRYRIYSVNRYLIFSGLFAGLSLLTKTNGIIMYAVIGISSIYKIVLLLIKKRIENKKQIINIIIFSALLIVILSGSFVLAFSKQISTILIKKEKRNAIVSNTITLHPGLKVGNKLKNYIYFDIKKYLKNPYISTWKDETGRQFFSNLLLKTSIYGEFNHDNAQNKFYALVLGWGLLFFILIFFTGLFRIIVDKKEKIEIYLPLFLLGGLSVIALMAIRYQIPYACSNDFRYIYPSIITFIIVLAKGNEFIILKLNKYLNKYIKLKEINFVVYGITIIFIICSINHTLIPFIERYFNFK